MSKKEPVHPVYVAFLIIMSVILVIGVILLIYGSMNNGPIVPSMPGQRILAQAARLQHV